MRAETHGKCGHRESRYDHASFSHVEHILPKSHGPDLCFSWENLIYSCPLCNHNKRGYYDPDRPLLNPFVDNPDHLLDASDAILISVGNNDLANRTIDVIALNRPELIFTRGRRIRDLGKLAAEWRALKPGVTKDAALYALHLEAADDSEFAFVKRRFLARSGVPLP